MFIVSAFIGASCIVLALIVLMDHVLEERGLLRRHPRPCERWHVFGVGAVTVQRIEDGFVAMIPEEGPDPLVWMELEKFMEVADRAKGDIDIRRKKWRGSRR